MLTRYPRAALFSVSLSHSLIPIRSFQFFSLISGHEPHDRFFAEPPNTPDFPTRNRSFLRKLVNCLYMHLQKASYLVSR